MTEDRKNKSDFVDETGVSVWQFGRWKTGNAVGGMNPRAKEWKSEMDGGVLGARGGSEDTAIKDSGTNILSK